MDKTDIPGTFSARGGSAFGGNAKGATLGPVNPVREKSLQDPLEVRRKLRLPMRERIGLLTGQATEVAPIGAAFSNGVNKTNMARIWNKHKQINPVRSKTPLGSADVHPVRDDVSNGAGTPLKRKVFVAMSGGVDSSVAAALLKERGFDVYGVHMKMWQDPELPCTAKEDRLDAMRVAAHLGIPFETWDFTKEYKKEVVDYMVREYAVGRTPNPDVMCNRHIKFGIFLKEALKRGADYVATGHYVRLSPLYISRHVSPAPAAGSLRVGKVFVPLLAGRTKQTLPPIVSKYKMARAGDTSFQFKLLKGEDGNKDQSYFLWTLTKKQLRHCLFPIGDYKKTEVRGMARKFGLPTAKKPDSQGVCFIGEFDMREFLQSYIPLTPGVIATAGGREVGEHEGLPFYTIGQRQGIGIGGGIPFYVAEKDFRTNTLVVAEGPYDEGLFRKELVTTDINWISGTEPGFPLYCQARIRYRQLLQKCIVKKLQATNYKLQAVFDEPQRAVTPGQSIVFYNGEEMLGGGVIVC